MNYEQGVEDAIGRSTVAHVSFMKILNLSFQVKNRCTGNTCDVEASVNNLQSDNCPGIHKVRLVYDECKRKY